MSNKIKPAASAEQVERETPEFMAAMRKIAQVPKTEIARREAEEKTKRKAG